MKNIDFGGLLRCCLLSIQEAALAEGASFRETEGTIFTCTYCGSEMQVKNDVWRWRPPASLNTQGESLLD